jgi:hypothetical protein
VPIGANSANWAKSPEMGPPKHGFTQFDGLTPTFQPKVPASLRDDPACLVDSVGFTQIQVECGFLLSAAVSVVSAVWAGCVGWHVVAVSFVASAGRVAVGCSRLVARVWL